MDASRRSFISGSMAALGAAALSGGCAAARCVKSAQTPAGEGACPFRLGVAGYTLGGYDLDGALQVLKRDGVKWFCAKQNHYPIDASERHLKDLVKKTEDAGVKLYGAGPIAMNTADEAKKAFDYCAALGVPTLVGVPGEKGGDGKVRSSRAMCEIVSALVDEYGINFGIHNHGANPRTGNPKLYPTVVDSWEFMKGLSPRLGFCVDIAYTCADGFDASDVLRRFAPRVFDVHLRDTSVAGNGSSGAAAGDGTIDYLSVIRTLKEIGYSGVCGIELRNAFLKPSDVNPGADPSWLPRSVGYFRGLMAAV